jgi:uncharacterized membrane protein
MRRIAASLVILAYPLWSHAVIAGGYAGWSLPGLAVLCVLALTLRDGRLPRSPAALGVIAAIAGAGLLDLYLGTPFALYAPPILIPAFIAWVFGRTLLPGRRCMVQRFAEDVMNRDDPERHGYMRGLTWFWTLLLAGLALQALLLALFASPVIWSLFANGINYAIVVLAFIGEFLVRCVRFGIRDQPGEFWVRLLQTDFRRLG